MGADSKGVCTPACTIFSHDGARVDEAATEKHVDTLLGAGAHIIAQRTRVFVVADPLMLHGLIAGASGCFWGASSAIAREAVELYERVSAGDHDGAKSLWQRIYPLNQFVWSHPFNPSVKAAANLPGHDLRGCRRPVQPLTRAELAGLKQAVRRLSV